MTRIKTQEIDTTLKKNYMPYAMEVIVNRALPDVRDGLKPSHRYVLYTANVLGLKGKKTKSANLVGQTMKFNPHGDQAIYETAVRLTDQNLALLTPLFAGKGNFGKAYSRDMAYGASRYTEIGLSDITNEFFSLIDKETVPFVDNYDSTLKEPTLLPVTYPNILVNANEGIAVGMASKICSFNFIEVCEATIHVLQGNDDVTGIITAPDFPTGGLYVKNEKELSKIINTGKGSLVLKAVYNFDEKENCIEITEIPYTTTVEAIIDKITELVKLGKVKEISDLRDETDLEGLKIALDLKRGIDPNTLMQKLYKLTTLEDTYSCNFNVLYEDENGIKKPKVMGINEILKTWCEWRIECKKKEYRYDISQVMNQHHILTGLQKVLIDIDKAISINRDSENDETIITDLMEFFEIDRVQATYISNIRLKFLNNRHISLKTKELEKIKESIKHFNEMLNSDEKIRMEIIEQIRTISKKYGKDRKTLVTECEEVKNIKDILIDDYNCTYVITKQGYLKKNIRYSDLQKVKDGDEVLQAVAGNNRSDLLFFTNKANVYYLKGNNIDECTPSALGSYIPPALSLEKDEEIIHMVATIDYSGYMLYAYKGGKVAKIPMISFKTRYGKIVKAYREESSLVRMVHIEKDCEIVALSNINKMLVVGTDQIPQKATKNSQGVAVLKSKKNSYMTNMWLADEVVKDWTEDQIDYYRANRDAIGKYLKKEDDWTKEQLTL